MKDKNPPDTTEEISVANSPQKRRELVRFIPDADPVTRVQPVSPRDPDLATAHEILSKTVERSELALLIANALKVARARARERSLEDLQAALDFLRGRSK